MLNHKNRKIQWRIYLINTLLVVGVALTFLCTAVKAETNTVGENEAGVGVTGEIGTKKPAPSKPPNPKDSSSTTVSASSSHVNSASSADSSSTKVKENTPQNQLPASQTKPANQTKTTKRIMATSESVSEEPPASSSTVYEKNIDKFSGIQKTVIPEAPTPKIKSWSVVDLTTSLICVLITSVTLLLVFKTKERRSGWSVLTSVIGVSAAILFLSLNSFTGNMVVLSKWSVIFIGISIIDIAVFMLRICKKPTNI